MFNSDHKQYFRPEGRGRIRCDVDGEILRVSPATERDHFLTMLLEADHIRDIGIMDREDILSMLQLCGEEFEQRVRQFLAKLLTEAEYYNEL